MTETKARKIVYKRSQGVCEGCGCGPATDWSHRIARSQGGPWTPSNGLHLCRSCHAWIHAEPAAALVIGWRLESWQNPLTEPVTRLRRRVLLDDSGGHIPYVEAA